MKSKIIIFSALALIFSACSTGSYVATSWVDDVYFSPGDVPPPVALSGKTQQQSDLRSKSADRIIVSEIRNNDEGSKTMNNYIFDGQDSGSYADAQLYNLDQMVLAESDTTVYYDENEVKYVINNYFEGEDMDFTYRIRRFHRPYFYDPYYYDYFGWDSWWGYPYSSFSYGYGWGWPYYGWGSSWYWSNPYYGWGNPYYSWYSPYYSYWGWGYPYSYGYWGGYYGGYWGGYWRNVTYVNREDYRYGQRRDYNTSAVYGSGAGRRSGTSAVVNNDPALKSAQPGTISRESDGRRYGSVSGVEGGGRPARDGSVSGSTQDRRVHTELRRDPSSTTNTRSRYTSSNVARGTTESPALQRETRPVVNSSVNGQAPSSPARNYTRATQGTYTRPASADPSGNSYTPSYNQQRTVNRPTYNVQGSSRQSVASPAQENRSINSSGSTYTRPSSTNTVRTYQSTSTYNRSSSGSSGAVRTAAPSGSSGSFSAPNRSYSSPASSGGGSYSAPSRSSSSGSGSFSSGGGGSSSGSSGSSGHSSGSSNSGRR